MKVAVAVSGGVDSMVAAHLLKTTAHDIFAIHFVTGFESPESVQSIKKTAAYLHQNNIKLIVLDIHQHFQDIVIQYFVSAYASGQTPNPCVICNASIKFGVVRAHAMKLGADVIATGHYAQVEQQGRYHVLKKGIDSKKDQSYFLGLLRSSQLSSIIFPLGNWTKNDVSQYADKHGISEFTQNESQEICFIPGRYQDFLLQHGCLHQKPGPIITTSGKKIGEHNGLHAFTVGQRRGINCPGPYPYYVVKLLQSQNTLVVGEKTDLLSNRCVVDDINWILPPPESPINIHARIRYKTKAVASILVPVNRKQVELYFDTPQSAVTPGQIAIFYQEDIVLGGGKIIVPFL